jgi:hypothetical protein
MPARRIFDSRPSTKSRAARPHGARTIVPLALRFPPADDALATERSTLLGDDRPLQLGLAGLVKIEHHPVFHATEFVRAPYSNKAR